MDQAIWIAQYVLGGIFLLAGATKVLVPKEKLQAQMGWVNDFTQPKVRLIGLAEVLGGLGLLLPGMLAVLPVLTPVAASCLAVIMVGAVATHVRRKEPPFAAFAGVLGVGVVFVAVGRFVLVPWM
ncbi:MAG: DoxX family protein [Planctomycetota bacterium]